MSGPCPIPEAIRHCFTGKGSSDSLPFKDMGHEPALHYIWRATALQQHTTSTSASLDIETQWVSWMLSYCHEGFLCSFPGLLSDLESTWSSACPHYLLLRNPPRDQCALCSALPPAKACSLNTTNHPPVLMTSLRKVMLGKGEST